MSSMQEDVVKAEEDLRNAMINSDISVLERLLAPGLIFTNHMGGLMTKEDDLAMHQSGKMKIHAIDVISERITQAGDAAIVNAHVRIDGSFNGERSASEFRFIRVWQPEESGLRLIVAQSTLVA